MDENHVMEEMINTKMQISPKILATFAGKESCCVFRVPTNEINKKACQPQIISIGPYHHGNQDLQMMQEHKWRFLHGFKQRTDISLVILLEFFVSKEREIRESYSESIEHISSNDLAEMMLLDGVFLIELFQKYARLVIPIHEDDPIFSMVWVREILKKDLLKIENQIPFFVLQKLFDMVSPNNTRTTLPSLIIHFFKDAIAWPKQKLQSLNNLEGKHLLDFFRKSFIETRNNTNPIASIGNEPYLKLIEPATNLVFSGVKFMGTHGDDSFLDIKFRNGVLSIPQIKMDDFFTSFFLNVVAFEQCYSHCSKDFTTYVVFLGCLINNSTDMGLLSESKIIENYFGTDKEVVKFLNNIGKDVVLIDNKDNHLKDLFVNVNEYCSHGWHVVLARLKHRYFGTPNSGFKILMAIVFLYLASVQTLFAAISFHRNPDNK